MTARLSSDSINALVDAIYEVAFCPEGWMDVLTDVGAAAGSVSGLLMVFDGPQPLHFRATPIIHDIIARAATIRGTPNERAAFSLAHPFQGFVAVRDYLPPHILKQGHGNRLAAGLDSEASAFIPLPTGESVVFSFDRRQSDGPHSAQDFETLNGLYPHLARTALIASRLGLERATTAATTLQVIGLPAAVLTKSGRVLSSNQLFDKMTNLFLPAAFGRLTVADAHAHHLLQEALNPASRTVRSIPVGEVEGRPTCVLHVLPLRRNAQDIFSGADTLIAVTALKASSGMPSSQLLEGLFDLTASEVAFASALSTGLTVREASRKCGLTESSGRTYLARIFAKTGTHRQSELMALLSSTHPFDQEE